MLGRGSAQRNGRASVLACVCVSPCVQQCAPGAQEEWTYQARTRACVSASGQEERDAGHRSIISKEASQNACLLDSCCRLHSVVGTQGAPKDCV